MEFSYHDAFGKTKLELTLEYAAFNIIFTMKSRGSISTLVEFSYHSE